MSSTYDALTVDVADHIAQVTLIGPGKGNAMGPAFWAELPVVFAELDADPDVVASDVTHVVTVSCTGFHAPGPEYEIVRALGLADSVELLGIECAIGVLVEIDDDGGGEQFVHPPDVADRREQASRIADDLDMRMSEAQSYLEAGQYGEAIAAVRGIETVLNALADKAATDAQVGTTEMPDEEDVRWEALHLWAQTPRGGDGAFGTTSGASGFTV